MSKKSRERRERFATLSKSVSRKRINYSVPFHDTLMDFPAKFTVIKISDVYSQLRQTDYFTVMSVDEWSDRLQLPIKPPYDENMFFEFDFLHYSGSLERTGVAVTVTENILHMTLFCEFDGIFAAGGGISVHMADDYLYSNTEINLLPDSFPLTYNPYFAVLYSLQMINCRNITLVENTIDEQVASEYQSIYGRPPSKFKVLAIRPMGKRSENSFDQKDYQGLLPLHLRRGNFATYTDEKPLFGKYTGAFWRPATAVGEPKNGIVVKDYEIMTK